MGRLATAERGIQIRILGDSGPFSRYGRSIAYLVTVRESHYLIDCGAPVFETLEPEGVKSIRALIGTHSHDDHRRWFTDLALFKRYTCGPEEKLRFLTTEAIHEEFHKNSRGALERSLSPDAKRVIEIPYEEFVQPILLGPRSRYRIEMRRDAADSFLWRVVDREGNLVEPGTAKVVINHISRANRPRMLFRDQETGSWVEPESYYSFASKEFYEEDENPYVDHEAGLTIRALKSPVWHGPPTIGVELRTETERVVFSSDTVYDPELWQDLWKEVHKQQLPLSGKDFEDAPLIYGNINELIERTWSRRRYEDAVASYDDAVVIHDVSEPHSIVHTEYAKISRARFPFLILTHSPDRFVSELPLAITGKLFLVEEGRVCELVKGKRYDLDAELYVRDFEKAFVGYKAPNGDHSVYQSTGVLELCRNEELGERKALFRVKLYRDLGGEYFPCLPQGEVYRTRPDGQVERVQFEREGSQGQVVENLRGRLGASPPLEVQATSRRKGDSDTRRRDHPGSRRTVPSA